MTRNGRRWTVSLLVTLLWCSGSAGLGAGAERSAPRSADAGAELEAVGAIASVALPAIDAAELRDRAARRTQPGPYQVAEGRNVSIGLEDGTWEEVAEGRLWRVRIDSPGALHLNFGFGVYDLPRGATLHVISASDPTYYVGPYTDVDNSPYGLWTPMVPGDSAVIELFVPDDAAEPILAVTRAGSGIVDLFGVAGEFPSKHELGQCHIDVVCPQATMDDQERAVARLIINNAGFCTGTLLNDVGGTRKPWLLTAHHCQITAALAPTVVAYFNFKSATCGGGKGPETDTVSGSTLRASRADVDGTLLELTSSPPQSYGVYFAGWDRSGAVPMGTAGIHHPQGTSQAYCEDTNPPTTVDCCTGGICTGVDSHWNATWTLGTTLQGSSGSALFDRTSRKVIGHLTGGQAACAGANPNGASDCYGKFSVFWDGSSPAASLKDWLDPENTGTLMVDGLDSQGANPTLTVMKAGTGTGTVTSAPAGIDCGADCSEQYAAGTQVTLTAAAGAGSTFAGWSGGGCSGTGNCVVTLNDNTTVTATFNTEGVAGCTPDAITLCLPADNRFKVTVTFQTTQGGGRSGDAQAIPLDSLGTSAGGLFYFVNPTDPQFLVKVVNGCPVNNRFWVFYAATTNVGFDLTVTDTSNGMTKVYSNPDINAAPPIQDTQAFATCP